ncbi:closca isoform X2 [Lycorma delicatula]|uniref:closca isoform X2 n=1 Tax=Lycorma delicatula TaxID=130591 RepID=UPI003F51A8B5
MRLQIIWFSFMLQLLSISVKSLFQGDTLLESDQMIQEEIQNEVNNYLRRVKHNLGLLDDNEEQNNDRNKRETSENFEMLDAGAGYRFKGFKEFYKIPGLFTDDIVLFCLPEGVSKEGCFGITLEGSDKNLFSDRLVLYKFDRYEFSKVDEVNIRNGIKLSTLFINNYQYVVVAECYNNKNYDNFTINHPHNNSAIYKVNHLSLKLEHIQTFSDKCLSDVVMWEQKDMNTVFLAAATNMIGNFQLNTESYVYKWLDTYFDKIDSVIKTYNPKSITPFTIGSTMYLAIANYQNDKGETDIDSEIYRYNLDKETFLLHQKIRTHAAMDIKYFFFEKGYQKESFLVVANHFVKEPDETLNYETHSIIYKFSDDKYFMPFQSIKVSAPIQWLPVMRGTNKSLLFVVSRFYGVKAYQYNGWRFVESPVRYFGRLFDSAITTIREFIFNNKSLLTIANKGNDGTEKNVFKIIIERDNQVPRFKSEMESWCKKTLEEVKDGNIVLSHILNSVHDVPHIDDKVIEINSDFVLTGDSRIGNITIIVNNDDDRVNKSVIDENDKTLTQFINNAENELKDLMNSFDKAPVYSIQKSENFSAIEIDCYPNSCQFDELFIESLNGENLTLLLKNTVDVKEDFTLNSKNNVPLEFENVAIQSVINTTYINNHKLNDLVTKYDNNLNQTLMVRGSIIIDNEDGITVSGTVDEVSISNDSVLLTTGDQSFSGKRLIAESLNIGNLTIEKTINHVPLNSNKAVNKRDNLLKVIPKLEVENLTLTDGLISGINLLDVVNNTLKVKSDKQIITGYYTYENLEVDELFVNNIIQNTSVIISPKRMSDYSRTETFILKPSNNNNNNYYIDQDEMYSYRRASSNDYHPKPNRAPYTNFYGDIIIEGRLIIRGGILNVSDIKLLHENISVSDIITNGLKLNDVINRPFKFTTPFQTKTLKVNDINGIKPESLLQRNEDIPVPITGHKTFIGDIYLNGGAIVNGTINGIDITDFEKNVNDSSLVKEFDTMAQKSSSMNYDSENNQINKKNIDQNSQYEIQDIWETVIIKNDIDVKSLWINKTVNGIDINDIIQYIKNNGSKKFEKSKVFNGNAQINKFVDDIEGFNDKNLESTVYCDSVEIDSKNLRYIEDKHLSVRSLVFSGSLDGVPANEFGKWLLSEGDQVIMGQQRVSSIETLKGLNIISGVINGVNITELSEISVKINEPSNLSGITFDCLVKSNENVEVSGLTNGIDIPNDVVLKYRPSTISSPVVITGDKVLMNDLVVDNIYIKSLDNLCRLFSNTTSNQSLVISGNVTFSKEPYVNTLNNITLQLLSGLAWLYYEDKIFTSTVSFPDVVFHHDIDLQGSFNGINLELLNKEYLSLTKDQKINAPITFMNGVIVKGLLRAKKVNVGRHVNGVVLDKFVDNILKNGTEQHISDILDFSSITVQDNFKTKGFINGLNITSDVLIISDDYNNDKYSRNIVVNGRTTIKNVITNNVFTDPNKVIKIQGVDIKKWDDLAVRKTGKYNVHGLKD